MSHSSTCNRKVIYFLKRQTFVLTVVWARTEAVNTCFRSESFLKVCVTLEVWPFSWYAESGGGDGRIICIWGKNTYWKRVWSCFSKVNVKETFAVDEKDDKDLWRQIHLEEGDSTIAQHCVCASELMVHYITHKHTHPPLESPKRYIESTVCYVSTCNNFISNNLAMTQI